MTKLKTLAVPASIFLLLIAAVQPASAANWVELVKDSKEQTWSIDRDSVQTKGSIVSVWIKKEYPSTFGEYTGGGPRSLIPPLANYSLLLFEFDFSDRTYRQLAEHYYGGMMDGKRDTTPSGWERIVPNTIGEDIYSTLKKWLNR